MCYTVYLLLILILISIPILILISIPILILILILMLMLMLMLMLILVVVITTTNKISIQGAVFRRVESKINTAVCNCISYPLLVSDTNTGRILKNNDNNEKEKKVNYLKVKNLNS